MSTENNKTMPEKTKHLITSHQTANTTIFQAPPESFRHTPLYEIDTSAPHVNAPPHLYS